MRSVHRFFEKTLFQLNLDKLQKVKKNIQFSICEIKNIVDLIIGYFFKQNTITRTYYSKQENRFEK